MDYCFDTSAIGARHVASLYDDPERPALVAGLLASGRVLITAVNVIEAGGTETDICAEGRARLDLPNFQPLERGVQPWSANPKAVRLCRLAAMEAGHSQTNWGITFQW